MAITKALMYARVSSSVGTGTGLFKKARLAATRLNYYGPKILLKVNGTVRTYNFDQQTWTVTDRGRGQAKTLSVDVFGFTPAVGQEIILGGGAFTNRLFRGTITRIRRVHTKLTEGRIVYRLSCVDWSYQLGNLKVTKRYLSTSATAIAQDLIATFAPAGFTYAHVQTGLDVLDDFQCTMQTVPSALQQLCQRIGAAFYIDAEKDLHLYVGTDTTGVNPEALTDSNTHVRSGFPYELDIEGIWNRILVEGMGSTVSAQISAGFTTIPVADSSMFDASGGEAKLEAQRITYTGTVADSEGSLTAGTPGGAPTPPSPFQSSPYVTGNLVNDGSGAAFYFYRATFVSALGESDASALAFGGIAAVPNASGAFLFVSGSTGGSLESNGVYGWAVTFVTASGECGYSGSTTFVFLGVGNTKATIFVPTSSDGRVTSRKIYRTANGGSGGFRLVATIADNVTTSYVDTTADASLGATMPTTDAGSTGKLTVGIPVGPAGTTSRKLYRTELGGSTYKLQSTIADNTTTSVLDNTADGSLGATYTGSTLGAAVGDTTLRVSDLSKFPDGGWVRVGSQVVYFTGRSATSGEGTLTGVPASGTGAIAAVIPAGSTLTIEPHLTGVPGSGAGAIAHTISAGAPINLLVSADDGTSQGTYGIREDYVQDRRLSLDGAQQLADARLALLKDPRVTIPSMASSDPKLAAGRPVTVSFSTWGLTATVTVQTVTIKPQIGRPQPMLEATLASRSLDDLYAQLREIREQLAR